MKAIGASIREGAMAFLWREYKILAVYCVVVFGLIYWGIGSVAAGAFALGAFLSLLAGNMGMHAATAGNIRTAEAAGITLIAVVRPDSFEVFTHAERLAVSVPETAS